MSQVARPASPYTVAPGVGNGTSAMGRSEAGAGIYHSVPSPIVAGRVPYSAYDFDSDSDSPADSAGSTHTTECPRDKSEPERTSSSARRWRCAPPAPPRWLGNLAIAVILVLIVLRVARAETHHAEEHGGGGGPGSGGTVWSLQYWTAAVAEAADGDEHPAGAGAAGWGANNHARPPGNAHPAPCRIEFAPLAHDDGGANNTNTAGGGSPRQHMGVLPFVRSPADIGPFSALCSDGDAGAGAPVVPVEVRTGAPPGGAPHMEMHFAEGGTGGLVVTLHPGNLPPLSACVFTCTGPPSAH